MSENRVRSTQKARLAQGLAGGTGSTQLLSAAAPHFPSGRTEANHQRS